jgi:hypothetical protein
MVGGGSLLALGASLIWPCSAIRLDRHSADILGVSHRASLRTIRAAYIKLVKELYADGPNVTVDADERLKLINDAYQKVKDYDRFRKAERPDVSVAVALAGLWTRVRQARFFAGRTRRERPAIETPPCMRLNRFAQFVFTKRFRERFLTPCLADTQQDYFEALQEGDLRKARWISIRGVLIFWWTVFKQTPLVRKLWTLSGG